MNLSEQKKQEIQDRLTFLYKPENRCYLYEFLNKNCATEVRNLLFLIVQCDTGYQKKSIGKTYRMLIDECLKKKYWTKFGINLVLGLPVDKDVNIFQSMFLPHYLQRGLNEIQEQDHSLVESEEVVFEAELEKSQDFLFFCSPF